MINANQNGLFAAAVQAGPLWKCGQQCLLPFLLTFCVCVAGPVRGQQLSPDCGSLENAFGPFDYTDPANRRSTPERGESPLSLVERAHFTPSVERLVNGENSVADLGYTLRAFPNHHRALHAMATYQIRYHPKRLANYTIDCWFNRAIAFRPNDPNVRIIYGIYLAKAGENENALIQYKTALRYSPNLAEAHYNIGLLYADMGRYDLAREHAVAAYDLGFPLPGLRDRLVRAGAWDEKETKQR